MLRTLVILALAAVAVQATSMARLQRKLMPNNRIVGGEEVEPNSIPFQVSFQSSSGFHFCGGSVISASTILTAAHCCRGETASSVQVVAGEHDLSKDEGPEQVASVSEIIINEDYNSLLHSGDVCLLILSSPLELNSEVGALDLPAQGQEFDEGSNAIVSGWGTLSSGGSSPDTLYSVTVPVVSEESCKDSYGASSITPDMICAGAEGYDSCQGDSGGPMTCMGLSCGVVSWGRGCALAGYPGVYAKTSAFTDWIMDNMV